jgi:pimeloyl-ACP methyl ester carboxylesterase
MRLNHYRSGSGEPLVLIHGIGSHWQMWEPVIDRLVARRDVIAIDLPGFGSSPMPPAGTPAGIDSLASLVAGFLHEQGIERPHVAGNSLGGWLALELAKRGAVRSATAISPAGFANRPEAAAARASLWLTVRAARRMAPGADHLLASRVGRQLALGLYFGRPARIPAREAAGHVRALAAAPWFDETLETIMPAGFTGGDRIEVPVTIAWGSKDRLLLPRQAKRAAQAIPTACLVALTGCGHIPTYDAPELVTRTLLEGSVGSTQSIPQLS